MQQELTIEAMNCRRSLASQVWTYARWIFLPWIFNALSHLIVIATFAAANGALDDGPLLYLWYVGLAGIYFPPASWLNPLVVIAMIALTWHQRSRLKKLPKHGDSHDLSPV